MNSEREKTLAQVEKMVQFSISPSPRFFDRADIFAQLHSAFGDSPWTCCKSVALWGWVVLGRARLHYAMSRPRSGKTSMTPCFGCTLRRMRLYGRAEVTRGSPEESR